MNEKCEWCGHYLLEGQATVPAGPDASMHQVCFNEWRADEAAHPAMTPEDAAR